MELRPEQVLIQAFQKALADRSADRVGKPSNDYMLGYVMGMLQTLAEENPSVTEKLQSHLALLNQKNNIGTIQ